MTDEKDTQAQPAAEQPLTKDVKENTPTAIEQATALAERLDASNAKTEELLQRQEQLHSEQMLGGHSSAGQQPEPVKEESAKEYSERIMRGDLKDGEGKQD